MAQVIRCGIIEDSAKEASLLDWHNGWETKVGGHAGQIIVAVAVAAFEEKDNRNYFLFNTVDYLYTFRKYIFTYIRWSISPFS